MKREEIKGLLKRGFEVKYFPARKVWRTLTFMSNGGSTTVRVCIPCEITRHIPWIKDVKKVLFWAEDDGDKVVVHMEIYKPPRLATDHLPSLIAVITNEFGYKFKRGNVFKAFSNVFRLTERDLELLNNTYTNLISIIE